MHNPERSPSAGSALSGIRVLDLGRIVAAPYAAQLLGDLGADVIKIERPAGGDDVRSYRSPHGPTSVSAHFASWNRNKRSITVDLSVPDGQEVVRKLAAKADVLIENYVPGTMARFGLDYESLRRINPGLIYCSVSGYGHTGPYSSRPGMDHVFQAQGGIMSVIGVPSDQPGGGPVLTGIVITDCSAGRDASCAILAALFERTRSGLGQHIDIALLDSAVGLLSHAAQEYLLSGHSPSWGERGEIAWAGFLDCRDGKIFVLATRNHWFSALCEVLQVPGLAAEARFATGLARFENKQAIEEILAPLAKRWNKADLADALAAMDVPASPVNEAAEVFADAQVKARGMAVSLPAPYDPELRVVRSPLSLSRTPPTYRLAPPSLGQHTEQVLADDLGLAAGEIERLRKVGAI